MKAWPGYQFTMGDYGYLDLLEFAGKPAGGVAMDGKAVETHFRILVQVREDFPPVVLAERVQKGNDDVQYNPDFFDAVQPSKTLAERVRLRLRKLFAIK